MRCVFLQKKKETAATWLLYELLIRRSTFFFLNLPRELSFNFFLFFKKKKYPRNNFASFYDSCPLWGMGSPVRKKSCFHSPLFASQVPTALLSSQPYTLRIYHLQIIIDSYLIWWARSLKADRSVPDLVYMIYSSSSSSCRQVGPVYTLHEPTEVSIAHASCVGSVYILLYADPATPHKGRWGTTPSTAM